jgi:hypothetical protein
MQIVRQNVETDAGIWKMLLKMQVIQFKKFRMDKDWKTTRTIKNQKKKKKWATIGISEVSYTMRFPVLKDSPQI